MLDVTIPPAITARGKKTLRPCLAVQEYGPLLWVAPRYRCFQPPSYLLDSMPWPTTRSIGRVWETRAAVLGSYQWWMMLKDHKARAARWTTVPASGLHREVTVEVYKRVAGWIALKDSPDDAEEGEAYVRDVALDWGAKLICLLVEEWEFRTKDGLQAYVAAYKASKLPWQRFVTDTEHLFKSEAR
ncbi:hypothetical protein K466DRAFT_598355 [Polyporus arcularius HHB13444]|uniref:Uncharacterized protein n=1 Tax=Polyporus arcularius HHB13444 TaxID=1314778 RepID=A0A5C3PHJ8_9APHY|nr:hypothetical protein K466DRAFT_598355 [Polyporus arcularius HHB13444]